MRLAAATAMTDAGFLTLDKALMGLAPDPWNPSESLTAYQEAASQSAFASRLLPRLQQLGLLLPVHRPVDAALIQAVQAAVWARGLSPDQALRQFRNAIMLAILTRDLSGAADLDENLDAISTLAEVSIQAAYQFAAQELENRHGQPLTREGEPLDLLVVGMGKLGGRELNASSDVDLVYLVAEEGETSGRPDGAGQIDTHSFFGKLGRRMANLLSEFTPDGHVFRVDLRLRPNGDSGPLICSLAMLEEYLVVQGREWERYAWVKARVINRPAFQSQDAFNQTLAQLEELRRPFVFRRYLDFNALSALRDLHRQIREEADRRSSRRESRHAGDYEPVDVKLGPGGIREVEFVAQLFQLIRGGRDESLRAQGTREILVTLGRQGRITQQESEDLLNAYRFWRRLEHRLQYQEDAQTHVMSGDAAQVAQMARAMGYEAIAPFVSDLQDHRQRVLAAFNRLFRGEGGDQPDAALPAQRATDRESRLARIHQVIETVAGKSRQPDFVRGQMTELVSSLSGRASYLALFDEFPQSLHRVGRVIDASSWAAGYLRQHPIVLDELLDDRLLEEIPQIDRFREDLRRELQQARLGDAPDVERQMDLLREAHHGQIFRLMVQDLEGRWPLEALSDQISALADAMLDVALEAAWQATPRRHRDHPAFAIVGYGKLGGKELGYASDLDLIFVYDDPHDRAPELYARLAQRLNVWLSTQTAAGSLFEIDLRLRPNGNAGLLVTDLPGFIQYQQAQAWVWEHQALTRARFCAGDPEIGAAFEAARCQILRLSRPATPLLEEVLAMRTRMHEGHPNASDLFDLKHDTGGMVDIEFMVQALVLRHAHDHPELTGNLGNIALLGMAAQLGLVPDRLAAAVAAAYRVFRRHQHRIRLAGAASARLPLVDVEEEVKAVKALWQVVFQDAPAQPRSLQEIHSSNHLATP